MRLTRIFRTTGFRLAALYGGLFGLSVVVLFGVIYWITDSALRQQVSSNVETDVATLVAEQKSGGMAELAATIRDRMSSSSASTNSYLLIDAKGDKIAGDLKARSPVAGWQQFSIGTSRIERHASAKDMDPEHRLLALGTILPDGSFLLVGEDTFRITELEEAIFRAFGWAFGVTILLGAVGGSTLSFGFLRRIDAINRTSQAIVEGRLADRIPTRGTDDELDQLALNLNQMLDRVQSLMLSLREVSNDIAHDLRTPLSRLRQRLEAARTEAGSIEDYEHSIDGAIEDVDAALKTFGALLGIAQIEAGTRKAGFAAVDLSALFQSIADAYGAVAEDEGKALTVDIDPDIRMQGDRELLTQMLANLIENAIRHTPPDARIGLALRRTPAGARGVVTDNGPGIPAEVRDKVFQRFFRLERSRSTPGSGLGLSLVAAVAELHGIKVTLEDNEPGLAVVLDFEGGG